MTNQAPRNQQPVLFYSPKCEYSKKIIDYIGQNKNMASAIMYVNINEVPLSKLPPTLKSTPSILHLNNMFKGEDAFKWVQEQLRNSVRQTQQQQQQQQPPKPQFNVSNDENEPEYLSADINGCTGADCELFKDEKVPFNGQDNRAIKSNPGQYLSISEFEKQTMINGQETNTKKNKISDDQLSSYENSRKNDIQNSVPKMNQMR